MSVPGDVGESSGWEIIAQAKQALIEYALAKGAPIHKVEYVATFEPWDSGIGVYIFFKTGEALRQHERSGATKELEAEYLRILRSLGYPFSTFPDVKFFFDSDENVQANYRGSYFYRLR
jgi:hypothetical protein